MYFGYGCKHMHLNRINFHALHVLIKFKSMFFNKKVILAIGNLHWRSLEGDLFMKVIAQSLNEENENI